MGWNWFLWNGQCEDSVQLILNDVWLDVDHGIWWVKFCFPHKTDNSPQIGRGLGTAEQEVMDHLSHLTMCVWPRHLSEVTWSHRNSLVSRIGSPPRDRCHSLSAESSWPLMLYCTEEWHLTLLTHRMSADCYFTCHITLILEMISGYLETKEKKSLLILLWATVNWNHKYLWMEN